MATSRHLKMVFGPPFQDSDRLNSFNPSFSNLPRTGPENRWSRFMTDKQKTGIDSGTWLFEAESRSPGAIEIRAGRTGIIFLESQFVHKYCGKDVDRFEDKSKNIIKVCAFLRIALFLINKIIYNINRLYWDWRWYWVCEHGGLGNLELTTISIMTMIKTQK